jgi:Sulfotransferase family
MSAGGFALYEGYLPVYKMLVPRFGPLDNLENRKKLLGTWLRSKGFRRSGLEAESYRTKVLAECRDGGDFLRITMEEIAKRQQADRWAVYDPDNVLYMSRIKAEIPDALFVHIIRDGRDIAVSLKQMGGFRPFPWDRQQKGLLPTAMFWEWMVRKGRENGRRIPADYYEIHYEELVKEPRTALDKLGRFLGQDLDYDRIRQSGVGRVRDSNSSFRGEGLQATVNPVARWKQRLSEPEIAGLEAAIGDLLEELGYSLTTSATRASLNARERWLRWFYPQFLNAKLWLRVNTPVGRYSSLEPLEVEDLPATL